MNSHDFPQLTTSKPPSDSTTGSTIKFNTISSETFPVYNGLTSFGKDNALSFLQRSSVDFEIIDRDVQTLIG